MRGARTFEAKLVELLRYQDVYDNVKITSENEEWLNGFCPFHEDPNSSKSPSFAISKKTLRYKCQSLNCGMTGDAISYAADRHKMLRADMINKVCDEFHVDRPAPKLKVTRALGAMYVYCNEECVPNLKKNRWHLSNGEKTFTWTTLLGESGRRGNVPTLYKFPEILKAPLEQVLFVVEGEKKVKMLADWGVLATCNPDGAGKGKFALISESACTRAFSGRDVCVIQDNDIPGAVFANEVCKRLKPIAKSTRLIAPPVAAGQGIDDWIEYGGTKEKLIELYQTASPWEDKNADGDKAKRGIVDHFNDPGLTVDEMEAVLIERWADIQPIFVRGNFLVTLTEDGSFSPLRAETLLEIISRIVQFSREAPNGEMQQSEVRNQIVQTYMARTNRWKLPRVKSTVHAPYIGWDGKLYSAPGYHKENEIWLNWQTEPIRIKSQLTKADASGALAIFTELFEEFPFVDAEGGTDTSAALSAVLTAIQRPMLASAPLYGISAPTPSTGKSVLANLCAIIATGKPARAQSYYHKPEELEKAICTVLMEGPTIILFDNVTCDMNADILCQVVTEPLIVRRVLGVLEMAEIPTAVTIFATGNNLGITGDMVSRSIFIDLDSKLEHPEDRVFSKDIKRWAFANREELLRSALTVVAAYVQAGFPGAQTDSRFQDWSKMIRSAIMWLGLADPYKKSASFKTSNPAIRVLDGWRSRYGVNHVSVRELLEELAREDYQQSARFVDPLIDVVGATPTIRKLSAWLERHRGRVFGGMRLCKNDKTGKWWVE